MIERINGNKLKRILIVMKKIALKLILVSIVNFSGLIYAQKDLKQTGRLQSFSLDEIPSKYESQIATEGLNISRSKKLYSQEVFFCYIYSNIAFVKIDNKVFALRRASHNPGYSSFTTTFTNSDIKLIIRCSQVKEIPNYPMEGWSEFKGNIELIDKQGNRLELVQGFYAEGV